MPSKKSEKAQNPWRWRLCALALAIAAIWWLGKKPSQPPGYKRYMCHEAYRGARGECVRKEVDAATCDRIADSAQDLCDGLMPEEYADPN